MDPTGLPGFITRAELVDRYAAGSGRDLSRIGFYEALAQWRLAVITQGIYMRYANGAMGDDQIDLDDLGRQIEAMAERALAAIA
jgi:aminoglycoside phosphotransferase (APT) family kinase protein